MSLNNTCFSVSVGPGFGHGLVGLSSEGLIGYNQCVNEMCSHLEAWLGKSLLSSSLTLLARIHFLAVVGLEA